MSLVLVIEDEEDISEFLRYVLESENFTVKTAASLAEARAHLKGGMPDAVLLDRGLPDGDGLDICRELKGAGKMPAIPVILFGRKFWERLIDFGYFEEQGLISPGDRDLAVSQDPVHLPSRLRPPEVDVVVQLVNWPWE